MFAVDTNLMVYAHRRESTFHDRARDVVEQLAGSKAAWAIPWPCVHEFYSVVTNPRAFQPASSIIQASQQLGEWFGSPSLTLLHEAGDHWRTLHRLILAGRIVGGQVHDARIAAICIEHDVREFWTADRDFNRFPDLTVRNPPVG